MTNERPRPQYGEYATPAEVAAARGPMPPPEVVAPPNVPTTSSAAGSTRPPAKAVSRWDRPLTIALLAFGVVNVATSASVYLDFARSLRLAFTQLGAPGMKLAGPEVAQAGIAALIIDSVLILAAIVCSYLLIRRGRRALWVPIVAFIVHAIAINLLVFPIVLNDPGYQALLHNLT